MKTPLISVALASYNGAEFIADQLESLLKQSMPVDEIVICDDCSADETWAILGDWQQKFPGVIKIFRNESNLGCYRNFEAALSRCRGKYIFLCDQDDIWHPEKIARLTSILLENPECHGVFCDSEAVNAALRPLGFSFWQMRKFSKRMQKKAACDALKVMLKRVPVAAHSVALRREALEYLLPFPELPGFYPDSWIALQTAVHSQWALTDEKLTLYRVHSANATAPQLSDTAEELRRSRAVRDKNGIANTAHLGQMLLDKMPDSLPMRKRRMLKGFAAHYRVRAKYADNLILRSWQIAKEVCRGRYFKYSNGIKSIAADLLLH